MTNPNDPAHPTFEEFRARSLGETIGHYHGLTKREYFAAMAMQGLLPISVSDSLSEDYYADRAFHCVKIADAMIIELNKKEAV